MEPGIKKSITIPNISLYRYITITNVDCMSLYTMGRMHGRIFFGIIFASYYNRYYYRY
jgi:hypothetical protein